MPRGFLGFYLKITVAWLNLRIRCTWIFIWAWTEALSKRNIRNTLVCPSYCNFTSSCKRSIGQVWDQPSHGWAKEDL